MADPVQKPQVPNLMTWGQSPRMLPGLTFSEIGQSGLRAFGGWVREEFLPQLVGRQGARVYREMADNNAIVASVLFAINSSMSKVEWRVDAAAETPQAQEMAEFAESLMHDMTEPWESVITEANSMLVYGYAPLEIVYKRRLGVSPGPDPDRPGHDLPRSEYDDGRIGWRKLPIRGQDTILKWFFDEHGSVKGITQQPYTGPIIDMPIEKMLLFRPSHRKGNPEGYSLLRNSYRSYHFIKRLEEQEAIVFERLGGIPVVRVPGSLLDAASAGDAASVAAMEDFRKLAINMRIDEQMGVVMPSDVYEGMNGPSSIYKYSVELVTPQTGRGTGVSSEMMIQRHQLNIMVSVMADFLQLGHGARGTQSLSVNKTDMFFQAVEGFLNSEASIFNRHGLPRVWDLNGMDRELMPKLAPDLAQRVDLDILSNFVLRMSQSGMPIFPNEDIQRYLLDAAGMPDATDPLAIQAAGLTPDLIDQASQPKQPMLPGTGQPMGRAGLEKAILAEIAKRIPRLQSGRHNHTTKRRRKPTPMQKSLL